MKMSFKVLFLALVLFLLQSKLSGAQTCRRSDAKVQRMRLQIPSDPNNLAINDNGATRMPSAALDGFSQNRWKRFLNAVHLYDCSDNVERLTLRNSVELARRYYFFNSAASNQLSFKQEGDRLNSPDNEGILHTFHLGPSVDFLMFISAERRNTLRINGANIIYGQGRFYWNVFPTPKFDGQKSDGELWGGNAEFRGRSLEEQIEQRIQIFRRAGDLDTISLQDPNFNRVPTSVLEFDIRSYKLYTGFDNRGRFTYVRSIVLKDPRREYYIAPTIDLETGIAPLCETFTFSRFRRPIMYQTVTLKRFDDAAEARRSPLVSGNINSPYLADERWFQVERRNEEFVRLRLSYDLDKYLAMMRVGENDFRFVITHFRRDASNVLSYDFDVQFPVTRPAERPQLPCMVDNTCSWPGEVMLRNRTPNIILSPRRHPSCPAPRTQHNGSTRGESNHGGSKRGGSRQGGSRQGQSRRGGSRPGGSRHGTSNHHWSPRAWKR